MAYICKHFEAHELVPKHIYDSPKPISKYTLFDDRLLKLSDRIRELVDSPLTINNWKWGGDREWCGLRTPESKYYSPTSQHTFGRAVDMVSRELTGQQLRRKVEKWMKEGKFEDIGVFSVTVEEGPDITWLHIDVRNNYPGYNDFIVYL